MSLRTPFFCSVYPETYKIYCAILFLVYWMHFRIFLPCFFVVFLQFFYPFFYYVCQALNPESPDARWCSYFVAKSGAVVILGYFFLELSIRTVIFHSSFSRHRAQTHLFMDSFRLSFVEVSTGR